MEDAHLIVHDSPWRWMIPAQIREANLQDITLQLSQDKLPQVFLLEELATWLEVYQQYIIQIDVRQESCPIVVMTCTLDTIEYNKQSESALLHLKPIRAIDDYQEYLDFKKTSHNSPVTSKK